VSNFIRIASSGRHRIYRISSQRGGTEVSQVRWLMSEVDLFRQYVKDRTKIETSEDQELFLEVATELQSEGVVVTHEVFAVIKVGAFQR
jgi:hypothetical protein